MSVLVKENIHNSDWRSFILLQWEWSLLLRLFWTASMVNHSGQSSSHVSLLHKVSVASLFLQCFTPEQIQSIWVCVWSCLAQSWADCGFPLTDSALSTTLQPSYSPCDRWSADRYLIYDCFADFIANVNVTQTTHGSPFGIGDDGCIKVLMFCKSNGLMICFPHHLLWILGPVL